MIYLDHSATSYPKAKGVAEAMALALEMGNPGRSGYEMAIDAGRAIYDVREKLSQLLGMEDDERLIFTSGATEALNLGMMGYLKRGGRVVSSDLEHNAVARVLHWGREHKEWDWEALSAVDDEFLGYLDDALKEKNVDLVVINHVSNVSGQRQPMGAIREICSCYEVPILWDVSQSIGCEPIILGEREMMAGGGHKGLRGPMGVGFLAVSEGLDLNPIRRGGTGSASESLEGPDFWPDHLEAGTPNLPGILGLGAALTELKLWDLTELLERAQALRSQLISGLAEMSSVKTMSPISGGSAVSFQVDVDMGALAHELWKRGEVAVRAGLHCSPMAHQALGSYPNGAIRASVSPISTNGEEIDKFLDLLKKMI